MLLAFQQTVSSVQQICGRCTRRKDVQAIIRWLPSAALRETVALLGNGRANSESRAQLLERSAVAFLDERAKKLL